jgi:hypothetical protein
VLVQDGNGHTGVGDEPVDILLVQIVGHHDHAVYRTPWLE